MKAARSGQRGGSSGAATSSGLPRWANHERLGKLYVTYGSKASKITLKDKTSQKPKLLIQIGESMSPDHAKICAKILKFAEANSSTKEECIEHRSRLLNK